MNFQEYVLTVRKRSAVLVHDLQVQHGLIGMITELGELADAFKKHLVKGKEIDNVNIMEEVGDFVWYMVLYLDEQRVHMALLDDIVAAFDDKDITLGPNDPDTGVIFALSFFVAALAIGDPDDLQVKLQDKDGRAMLQSSLVMLLGLLKRYGGYTISNCLERNDAKLEKRHGSAFQKTAVAVENRDLAAEREILEGGSRPSLAETVAKTVAEVEGDKGGVYGGCAA
jgi:NTP pyrophosphatase (non-canonical NTP hydrolase)